MCHKKRKVILKFDVLTERFSNTFVEVWMRVLRESLGIQYMNSFKDSRIKL